MTHQSEWDRRFFKMARDVATWSKDPHRKVGAALVSEDRLSVAVGYNGFPRGVADTAERLDCTATRLDLMVHAERNVLSNAKFSSLGATLYSSSFPCQECAKDIVSRRVSRVVAPAAVLSHHRWGASYQRSLELFEEAGILVTVAPAWGSLQLILGVSSNGSLASSTQSPRQWLDQYDGKIFRILTGTGGGVCGAGRDTLREFPHGTLSGRTLVQLSRDPACGMTVRDFAERHPGAWLLGGPKLARVACAEGLVSEVVVCQSSKKPLTDSDGSEDYQGKWLFEFLMSRWQRPRVLTKMDTVTVEVWRD